MERGNVGFRLSGVSRTERLLMSIPILLCTVAGLAFGLTRFIFVVRDNLQAPASSMTSVVFLIAVFGGAALLMVLFSAAIGFLIGLALQLGYGSWRHHKVARPALP